LFKFDFHENRHIESGASLKFLNLILEEFFFHFDPILLKSAIEETHKIILLALKSTLCLGA